MSLRTRLRLARSPSSLLFPLFIHQLEVGWHSRSSYKGAMPDMSPDGSLQNKKTHALGAYHCVPPLTHKFETELRSSSSPPTFQLSIRENSVVCFRGLELKQSPDLMDFSMLEERGVVIATRKACGAAVRLFRCESGITTLLGVSKLLRAVEAWRGLKKAFQTSESSRRIATSVLRRVRCSGISLLPPTIRRGDGAPAMTGKERQVPHSAAISGSTRDLFSIVCRRGGSLAPQCR
jgi:hypothetical protein